VHTLEIIKQEEIAAPIDIVFETVLEQLGPLNETCDGLSLPMKLEAWPGGRWYRDLGNGAGHLWAHLQAIRPSTLLELYGPLFMSGPATSNVQYRLSEKNGVTSIQFSHRAVGLIPPAYLEGPEINIGWSSHLRRVREMAERKK
jgi:hypothetical protein